MPAGQTQEAPPSLRLICTAFFVTAAGAGVAAALVAFWQEALVDGGESIAVVPKQQNKSYDEVRCSMSTHLCTAFP